MVENNKKTLAQVGKTTRLEADVIVLGGGIAGCMAANPHELMRLLEVFDILTVAQIILQACLARRQTCDKLELYRTDDDGKEKVPFICISSDGQKVITREVPLDYAGNIKENYEKYNQDYITEKAKEAMV